MLVDAYFRITIYKASGDRNRKRSPAEPRYNYMQKATRLKWYIVASYLNFKPRH
jgi:hypothetical protein